MDGTKSAIENGRGRRRDYQTVRVLGTGSKATVKLAVRLSDRREVALKSIRKPGTAKGERPAVASGGNLSGQHAAAEPRSSSLPSPTPAPDGITPVGGDFAAAEREWRTEVKALDIVGNHENMPALVEAFETGSKWYIAMDYQRGGVSFRPFRGSATYRKGQN
jgi:serine/threonine protein kinase